MSTPIKLVQGDTRPYVKVTLTQASGAVLDLTGATVVVHFRKVGTTAVLANLACTLPDAANGVIQFNFPGTTLNVDPGSYEGEVEITFSDGTRQTAYEVLKFTVRAQFA